MNNRDVASTAAGAALRAGLIRPCTPPTLYRIARAVRNHGTNTSTLLAVAAARWPNRTAIIDDDGPASYRDLHLRTMAVSRALHHRYGVRVGQPIGILCRNSADFIAATLGAASIGAEVVLLNTDFNAPALASALDSHNIRVVLRDNEFRETVIEADPSIISIDPHDHDTVPGLAVPHITTPGKVVLLTSGTTGSPRGVPRSPAPAQIAGVAASILERTGLRVGSRVAVAVPFFHAFGFSMLTLTLTLGGTVITQRRFDAERMLARASLHDADAMAAVPVMLRRLLDLPEQTTAHYPVPALQVAICGGATLEPTLGQHFMDVYGDILYNGYGSSEVGMGSFATPADLRRSPNTVGRPVAGSPVLILDTDDQPVPTRTVGRIFVGGPLTFHGYTGGSGKPVVDGMTGTGDKGYLDERGCLYIVGREDDMIVSGGENVYPQAVENALAEHPEVLDSAAIGVPDDHYGQRLSLFVARKPSTALDSTGVRAFLRNRVSRFEQPRDIQFVESIPRNPTGKIRRNELQHTLLTDEGHQSGSVT